MSRNRNHPLVILIAILVAAVFIAFGAYMLYQLLLENGQQAPSGFKRIIAVIMGIAFLIMGPVGFWVMVKPARGESAAEATGVADREPWSGGSNENQPYAFRGQRPPPEAVVVARMPAAFRAVLLIVIPVAGIAMMAVALTMHYWSEPADPWVRYLMGGLGLVFILSALFSRNLRSHFIYFFATPAGVYFHNDIVSAPDTQWIFVPWCNIGDVYEREVSNVDHQGQTKTITFEIRASNEAEVRTWFSKKSHLLTGGAPDPESVHVAFGDVGIRIKENLPRLQRLWADAQ